MEPFSVHRGTVVPLDRANVDTDQIIPKQFLKSIKRTGFGENLFDAWRFIDEGEIGKTPNERKINEEFILNDPRYQGVSILLGRRNFGCGSSREHAVWALFEFGIRCVIAPSFADIFYNNCFKNGMLPIVLNAKQVNDLTQYSERQEIVEINLENQEIKFGNNKINFEIDPFKKKCLLDGLDDIALSLRESTKISLYEKNMMKTKPWIN